jgi:hypothetical protein
MRVAGIPVGRARDVYQEGQGQMLVKVASLITVADAKGEEMDQGSMMRYLSEMMWFPTAFLEDNISFEAIDATSARVTLADQGKTVTATLFFDSAGRLTNFAAQRYAITGAGGTFECGRRPSPATAKAVWKLARGDLEDINVTLTELRYDA